MPPGPVTVSTYVVVTLGETESDPFTPTLPIPLIEAEVALLEVHESVEMLPTGIDEGFAVNDGQDGKFGGVF